MPEIMIAAALIGSVAAGILDLKTTEVPDWLPIGMVIGGAAYWFVSWIITNDIYPLTVSLVLGTLVLALGLILFYKKQWGEADAWILAAVAYMIPLYNNNIFFYDYIFNFLIVAIAYLLVYSLILGLKNKKVFGSFIADIKEKWHIVIAPPAAAAIASIIIPQLYLLAFLFFFLMLFWRYALAVENSVFKKKIHVSRLKVGDVLLKDKWVGVTKEDIERLKKYKAYVTIKDGIRFVPVFAITIAVTLLWGNVFASIFLNL